MRGPARCESSRAGLQFPVGRVSRYLKEGRNGIAQESGSNNKHGKKKKKGYSKRKDTANACIRESALALEVAEAQNPIYPLVPGTPSYHRVEGTGPIKKRRQEEDMMFDYLLV